MADYLLVGTPINLFLVIPSLRPLVGSLAHLSLSAHRLAYSLGRFHSLSVRCPQSLDIFSSATTGPISQIAEVWTNGPGHMTKMATKPIYGKKL